MAVEVTDLAAARRFYSGYASGSRSFEKERGRSSCSDTARRCGFYRPSRALPTLSARWRRWTSPHVAVGHSGFFLVGQRLRDRPASVSRRSRALYFKDPVGLVWSRDRETKLSRPRAKTAKGGRSMSLCIPKVNHEKWPPLPLQRHAGHSRKGSKTVHASSSRRRTRGSNCPIVQAGTCNLNVDHWDDEPGSRLRFAFLLSPSLARRTYLPPMLRRPTRPKEGRTKIHRGRCRSQTLCAPGWGPSGRSSVNHGHAGAARRPYPHRIRTPIY
jgi:hypothetical protein